MADDGRTTGDSDLFAIFLFSILLLVALPTTIWRVCTGGGAQTGVMQPWQKKGERKASLDERVRKYANPLNIGLAVMWLLIAALTLYISTASGGEAQPFDPFEILEIPRTATLPEIKKAYRTLSKQYHPDKNPDPSAAIKFAEEITPAYRTLTDDAARENWIKHGHPDGPQAMHIGVALPEWFFTSDRRFAPLMLLGLVFVGLAVPILAISCYLYQTEGYVGKNRIMEQTLVMYHRYAVKELLRVGKLPESIILSHEYLSMPLRKETAPAFAKFSQSMVRTYALQDDKRVAKLHPALLRAYLFVIAYLDRNDAAVPPQLQRDYIETLRLLPILCEEFVRAACAPRNRLGQGWFIPAEAAVQFQQCVVQQVRLEVRAPAGDDKKKRKGASGEAAAALLQVPGVDDDQLRNLEKKSKIKSLEDLVALPAAEREPALTGAGVKPHLAADVQKVLLSLPHVHVTSARAFVDGEDDIKEHDVVTVHLHLALTRASHWEPGYEVQDKGGDTGVQAYAPRFSHPVHEKWWVFLRDGKNMVWQHANVALLSAEAAGFAHRAELGCKWHPDAAPRLEAAAAAAPAADAADANAAPEPIGQKVEFKFMVGEAGKHDLEVVVMPSCWVGCDVTRPLPLEVLKQSAAEREGRGPGRGRDKAAAADSDKDASADTTAPKPAKERRDGDSDDGSESDEDEDADSEGWDTDETGSAVTHSDADPEEDAERAEEAKKDV